MSADGFAPDHLASLPATRLPGGGALYADGVETAAPPMLFVHGGYHGAWCFGGWMRLLAPARRVFAVDMAGHGTLPHATLDPRQGIGDWAADVAAAVRRIGTPPVLVGHSLGALAVMLAATEVAAARLVLLAPSPPGNLPGVAAVPLVDDGAPVPPPDAAAASARWFGGDRPDFLADWLARLGPESPTVLNDRYGLRTCLDPARIAAPVLVVEAGRDDAARHPAGQDEAIARFLRGRHVLLPDAVHCLMAGPGWWEAAALVADQ